MADVFISYSRRDYVDENNRPIDGNVISEIKRVLAENGLTYWIDEEGIYSGEEFPTVIYDSIVGSDCVVFVSTYNSNNLSRWTQKEINLAFEEKKPVFPVICDNTKFNKGIRLALANVDHIEYVKSSKKALDKLVATVQKNKQQVEAQKQRESDELERKRKIEEERKNLEKAITIARTTLDILENNRDLQRKELSRIRGEYDLVCRDFQLNQERISESVQFLTNHNVVVNHLLLENGDDGISFRDLLNKAKQFDKLPQDYEKTLEEQTAKNEELTSEVESAKSMCSRYLTIIDEIDRQLKFSEQLIVARNEKIEKLRREKDQLVAKLDESAEKVASLSQGYEQLTQEFERSKQTVAAQNRKIAGLLETMTQKDAEIQSLKARKPKIPWLPIVLFSVMALVIGMVLGTVLFTTIY